MNPALNPVLVREAALVAGVCARPVVARVTDIESGEVRVVPIPCGSTREDCCPPCADRAMRLRMQPCREGWHRDTEPEWAGPDNGGDAQAHDEPDDEPDDEPGRRVRSTRRRQDVSDLPRLPMEDRTIGRVFTTPDGKTFRPSMFLTLTLPSYGRVTAEGVAVDPASYDYRRAVLDALHFPKLVDRFWQNLRRCAGYRVQYFATIEPQRRLAPHLHAAMRGTIPRRIVREVRAATYHQVWWPAHDTPVYVERLPRWSDEAGGYLDPDTGAVLPTWDQALDALDADPDAEPAHVVRFGEQDDLQGLLGGTPAAERRVQYLCKYLTKDIATTYDHGEDTSPGREAHIDRLAEEVRWLPCAPTCANWLRFGVQPKEAEPGMLPGHCKHKAHDRTNLGLGGRRVLVSRQWTGKTSMATAPTARRSCAPPSRKPGSIPTTTTSSPSPAPTAAGPGNCSAARVDNRTYAAAIAQQITTRQRWLREYEAAKAVTTARAGPAPPEAA
jgi:hypothetical protein